MNATTFVALCAALSACASNTADPVTPAPAGPTPARASAARPAPRAANPKGAVLYQTLNGAAYVLRRIDTVDVQLPNGSTQTSTLTRIGYLSVSATGMAPMQVSIVLDSLTVDGPVQFAAAADSARGTRWTGMLAADGHLSGMTANRVSAAGEQMQSMLSMFFPVIPAGGARAGATWADTTSDSIRADAFVVQERAIATSLARGPAAHNGGQGIAIETRASFTRSGVGTPFGQPADLQSTGSRQITSWLGTDGVFMGSEGSETSDMTLNIHAMGQSIPIKQRSSFSIMPAAGR